MARRSGYKLTLFDRHGPDGVLFLRSVGYGLMVFGSVIGATAFATAIGGVPFPWWVVPIAMIAGVAVGWLGWTLGDSTGMVYRRFMVDGTSTPYVEQYSYQQALVMQGRLDDALESFEAVIVEKPTSADARIRAAELYAQDKKNAVRAAELFREVQAIPEVPVGQVVYASQRLIDLYLGPLESPGKAMGELRRLIDRYPDSPAAGLARSTLAELKSRKTDSG